MAHQVKFSIPERELGRSDIEFKVRKGRKNTKGVVGTLKISKGAVVWTPTGLAKGYKIGWSTLASLIMNKGRFGSY
jgi:hypothetical protein